MKRKPQIVTSVSAILFLSMVAMAQDAADIGTHEQNCASATFSPAERTDRLIDTVKASDILGITVRNFRDQELGKVTELAVDLETGRIVEVILTSGGFPGLNYAFTAVPPGILHPSGGYKFLHLDASVAAMNTAPRFDPANWNQCTQSGRVTAVYGYYGAYPYFVAEHGKYRTNNVDGIFASTLPRYMDGTINTAGGRSMETTHNQEIARDMTETNNPILTQYPDGTWTTNHLMHNDGLISTWSSLVYVQQASKLLGQPVVNLQNQKLGKVEDLVLHLAAGRIVAVIISSGGLPGNGGQWSAVPPTAMFFEAQQNTLQLDVSKEMLASSPQFPVGEWPKFSQSVSADAGYRLGNVESHSSIHAMTDANSIHKVGQTDAATTAEIRKAIIADNNMSTNAKSVQIRTVDGHVTLRGVVNSAGEKRLIGEIADRIARAANVDNELAVLMTTSSNN